jgi:uncharacterized repeat protein (TIGR01451 family)
MKNSCILLRLLYASLALLCAGVSVQAANFVTKVSVGAGNGWHNQTVWSNPPNTAVSLPVAGNTYEMIFNGTAWGNNTANTRMRNPPTDGLQTFPGDSFQMNTNTDLRFKRGSAAAISLTISHFPGVGGQPGLIMNGGVLNPGDDSVFIVTGVTHIASQAILSGGDNGGGAQKELRAMYLRGTLTGTGTVVILQSGQQTPHTIDADGSAFSGNWIIQAGFLRGSIFGVGTNSLGTGSIIVAPTNQLAAANATNYSKVEFMYDWNTPGSLILSNNPVSGAPAVCVLHQNVVVSALIVNGTSLAYGTYPWATLNSMYPANFPAGGSGQISVVPPGPPLAPLNPRTVGGDSQVTVSWSTAANAAGYLIKRADTDGGPYTEVGSSATTSFVDTGLVNGQLYYYVIAATNSLGSSADSVQVIGRPNVVVTNITAVGGTNQILLSWDAVPSSTGYTVLRSQSSGGPFAPLDSGILVTSYTDTAVASGNTYFYRLMSSFSGGSTSAPSATVSATTAPGTPTLTSALFASTVVRLSWTTEPAISRYYLESSTDGVNFSLLASQTQASFTNSGLALSNTYYYRVQASNVTGLSAYSAVVSNATPVFGLNVNFQLGTAPLVPGYLKDIGDVYGDRTNSNFYGWTTVGGTNITVDARWRQNAISPDLRYDTFIHLMKANLNDPSVGASWEIAVPNGPYTVRLVSGESDNTDGTYIFNVEGVITPTYTPGAGLAHWGDQTVSVAVTDGRITIKSAPGAINTKIAFVDIYPDIPVPIVIGTQPQGQTNEAFRPVSLAPVLSQGSTPNYQWYFNGNVLDGATNRVLFFRHIDPTNAGDYFVIITNYSSSATSEVATLGVTPDVNPPLIASVGSLDGNTIGVCFTEEIDTNSPVAQEFSNYQIDSGNITVNSVIFRPDGKSVVLVLGSPITGTVSVDLLDIPDLAQNATISSTSVVPMGFTAGDVGTPTLAGRNYTCDNQTIEMVGGGADIWNNADQGYFATKIVTGDFDARVRVTGLAGSNTVTKGVLVARESRNADSANVHVSLNPPAPARNQVEMGLRPAAAAATVAVGSSFVPAGVPNGWMRLTRLGNVFTGYRSTNGVDWILLGQTNVAFGSALEVGLAVTAHDNTLLATGTFDGLIIDQGFPDISVSMSAQTNVALNSSINYSITVANLGVDTAAGVVLTDVLPVGVTYVSATPSQGSCTFGAGTVSCNLGPVAISGGASVAIVVTATNIGNITNTAFVSTTSSESNTGNNSATFVTTVNASGSSPVLVGSSYSGGAFSGGFVSEAGVTYEVQYSHSVVQEPWITLTNIVGDGVLKTFTDPTPAPDRRFYRILVH